MKKLLSVILAAVMLLGCMSITAFADAAPDLSMLETGAKIMLGTQDGSPVEWVIGGDGTTGMSVPEGCIALVTSDIVLSGVKFIANPDDGNAYATSNLRTVVEGAVTFTDDEQAVIQERTLAGNQSYGDTCDGVAGDSVIATVWAPTTKDAGALYSVHLSEVSEERCIYWLCSPGYRDDFAAIVIDGDYEEMGKSVGSECGVRAALYLDLSKVYGATAVEGETDTYTLNLTAPEEPTTTTITWEPSDYANSYCLDSGSANNTIKGITLSFSATGVKTAFSHGFDGSKSNMYVQFATDAPVKEAAFTFASSVGKISKIEITCANFDFSEVGSGWSSILDRNGEESKVIWEGTPADSVDMTIQDDFMTISKITSFVFTVIPEESSFLTTFTLNKDYDDKYSTTTPKAKTTAVSETVTYTITPISTGDDVPVFTSSTFTIDVTDGVGSADVTLPEVTATGDYWYSIQETGGKTAGVTYDTNTYYLHLVTDCKGGEFGVLSAQIHKTAPDLTETDYEDQFVNEASDKIDTVSNSYGEGKLKITQDTKVDGADNDYDEFEVTVTFTLPEGAEITGDITYGDQTISPEDWENGSVTVTVALKDGEYVEFIGIPDGTTYTVEQTESNTDLGFGDPDYTVENGETGEDVVVTESDKETKVTGTISDGEDDITVANEMNTPVDVGVILENGAFILLALGAIAFGAWLIVSKRRRSLDAE